MLPPSVHNHHHYYTTHSMLMVRVMVAVFSCRVRDCVMMQRGYKRRDVNRNSKSGGR